MTLEEVIRLMNGEYVEGVSPAPQQSGIPAFPSLEEIQRASASGAPGSPEMQAAEMAALYPMLVAQGAAQMTPEQVQSSKLATQILSQNPNYPDAGRGLMGFLGEIAPYAVAAIIGGGAAYGLAGAGAAGGATAGGTEALGTGITAGATGAGGLSAGATGAGGITAGGTAAGAGGIGAGTAAVTGAGALAPGAFAAESLYPVAGGQTAAALGGAGTAAGTAASGTALSRILAGGGTDADWLQVIGQAGPSILSAIGSYSQAGDYKDLANKYMAMGAPYREELSRISADPNAFYTSPTATKATESVLQRLSATHGNPAGSPFAQSLTIDALYDEYGKERDRLAGFGGLTAYNQAAPGASAAGIGAQGAVLGDIGFGLGNVLNPQPSLAQLLRQYGVGAGSV